MNLDIKTFESRWSSHLTSTSISILRHWLKRNFSLDSRLVMEHVNGRNKAYLCLDDGPLVEASWLHKLRMRHLPHEQTVALLVKRMEELGKALVS